MSALDVSIQSRVINLLADFASAWLTMLFISHDLDVVGIVRRVVVLYRAGDGSRRRTPVAQPLHRPRALLAASPKPDPLVARSMSR